MKTIIILITFFMSSVCFAWGAPDLAPSEVRQKAYVKEATGSAKDLYSKALTAIVKSAGDSNEVIKLKDESNNTVVGKGNSSCDKLRFGNGFGKQQMIEFTFSIQTKDNKYRVIFEDVVGIAKGSYDTGQRPSNKEEMEKTIPCLDSVVNVIHKEMTKKADNW